MKHFKRIILIPFLLWSLELFSQLTVDGEFRPRVIIDNGYKSLKTTESPALLYISQRSRVNVVFKTDKLETCFSVQDVHVWGDDNNYSSSGMLGNTAGINLYQAWFMIKPTSEISVKTGRQSFVYDDQRILAARNWNDYQVTYDAVLFSWNHAKNKLDVAASWNASGATDAFYTKAKMKTIDFIRYEKGFDKFKLSGIAIMSGSTKADTLTDIALTGTFGTNMVYEVPGFDARLTAYYQTALNDVNGKISAYCLSVFTRKKFFDEKASLGIGLDILSGNDETRTNDGYKTVQHKFNVLYGTRHSLLGYMDYYNSIPNPGVQDYMLKGEYKFTSALAMQLDYHYFLAANKGLDSENTDKLADLGSEFDFTLQWKIMKEATLQAGYSFYLTTSAFEQWKGVSGQDIKFPQFAYLMVTVKPAFFKKE